MNLFKSKIFLYTVAAFAAILILFARNPQMFTAPQFWAEDGRVWFEDAHNLGFWESLSKTQDGYLQTLPRLVAGASTFLPLEHAPRVFAYASLLFPIFIVIFILSDRLKNLFPSMWSRVLLVSLFLLMPNTAETHGNLTNVQWYLALLAALVVLAELPKSVWQKIFDWVVLVLCGFTGPFVVFLFPLVWLKFFIRGKSVMPDSDPASRNKNSVILPRAGFRLKAGKTSAFWFAFAVSLLAVVQGISILLHESNRVWLFNFDSYTLFSILNRQIFSGFLFGSHGYLWLVEHISWIIAGFAIITATSLALLAYALVKARLEIRLLIVLGVLGLAASLFSPTYIHTGESPWTLLLNSATGARYWLIPLFVFATVLVWGTRKGHPFWLRSISTALLAVSLIGVTLDFRDPKLPDLRFSEHISKYSSLQKGEVLRVPINPLGPEDWSMELIKK